MSKYLERFPNRAFFPVIHVVDYEQAYRNTSIAFDNGGDGVFLINHMPGGAKRLLEIYTKIRQQFAQEWIGLNFLGIKLEDVFELVPKDANGLWTDTACIQVEQGKKQSRAASFQIQRQYWDGIFFGGVNFKYRQSFYSDPFISAQLAIPYVDIITTSGAGTGFEPSLEKIETMRSAIGNHPLANASGIDAKNIYKYLKYLDAYLVSTGISFKNTDELDPTLTRELADIIHKSAKN